MANSNPAFNRLEKDAKTGYAGFGSQPQFAPPAQRGADPTPERLQQMYDRPAAGPVQTRRVTTDDVIMKALGLFAVVLVVGVVGWSVASSNPGLGLALLLGGMFGTLILGFVIAFKKTLSVPLIVTYAVLEGLFVGSVSEVFNKIYPGIVAQAVLATLATFAGMLLAYKTGLIKVTDKFRRIVTMMIFGYAIFALVNFGYAVISGTMYGFGGTGIIGIGISVFAVGLASMTLALDFDAIDYAVRTGAPQKYSWLLAHGLIVTIVWLYIEFLRLLGRLRS
jgi:uncharacterized YccA/Bax inhibitor family protein